MKTSELIDILRKEDPSGKMEVGIDGIDIEWVVPVPYGYDGPQEILVKEGGEIVKARILYDGGYDVAGRRLKIHATSIQDALFIDPDLPVEVVPPSESMQAKIEEWRRAGRASDDDS